MYGIKPLKASAIVLSPYVCAPRLWFHFSRISPDCLNIASIFAASPFVQYAKWFAKAWSARLWSPLCPDKSPSYKARISAPLLLENIFSHISAALSSTGYAPTVLLGSCCFGLSGRYLEMIAFTCAVRSCIGLACPYTSPVTVKKRPLLYISSPISSFLFPTGSKAVFTRICSPFLLGLYSV